MIKQGDIVVMSFPFADTAERKERPAVVLSNTAYNKQSNVLFAGIYTKKRPHAVLLTTRDVIHKKLNHDSYISLQNIASIDRGHITKVVDTLSGAARAKVLKAFRDCL
jgi:mRNA-degrading endonuclease toxin of MazEF toxin-antitoxin module